MKKVMIIVTILTIIFVSNDLTKEKITIPKNAIRFRVIASSNSEKDQQIKKKVARDLEKRILKSLSHSSNIEETRNVLKSSINTYQETIDNTLAQNNCDTDYSINYGKNYFPSKNYRGITYQEGEYESLVVKLGKGEGKNFWCVLFPPLCLIDDTTSTDTEYHFLVKDVIKKYLKNK